MKWEYKSLLYEKRQFLSGRLDPVDFANTLNQKGEDGWELVSVTRTAWGPAPAMLAVFKRPKDET